MRQLYINGKPAVIKSGSSFKFYRENIYFTNAEDYTLDVTLPLRGCPENLDIFSAIHRPEMSAVHLIGKKYPFHLISPPLDIEGSAIVTEISEAEVKVQLIAGANALNFDASDSLGHDVYIDELDLGKTFDVNYNITTYDLSQMDSMFRNREDITKPKYDSSEDKCVFFPVFSEEEGTTMNCHRFRYSARYGTAEYTICTENGQISAQPYLLLIIERVLKAIGYELNPDNAIAKSWQRNIFIANGRNEYKYANLLPHWTVSEFLKEVSLFCGVFFTVEGNIVNATRKADYYRSDGETIVINDVIDEYTTEIDKEDEGSKDPLSGNIGYDFDSIDPMLRLPDEVWRKANIIDPFYNETSMRQWAGSYSEDKSDWILSEKKNHGVYTYIEDSGGFFLTEVDQVGSILRDGNRRDIDVSLRIVPAKMVMDPVSYDYTDSGGKSQTKVNAFYIPKLMTAGSVGKIPKFSVNNAVNPFAEEEEPSKPERIEVAYNDGGKFHLGTWKDPMGVSLDIIIPLATGIPYARESEAYYRTLFTDTGSHGNLLLKEGSPMYEILSPGIKIDTRVKHIFQFVDSIDPNPKSTFVIRGRKYACEKIEFNIEDQGLSPIKRGYFYEIND